MMPIGELMRLSSLPMAPFASRDTDSIECALTTLRQSTNFATLGPVPLADTRIYAGLAVFKGKDMR